MHPPYITIESDKARILQSQNYNYLFKYDDGFFARWGKTKEEDPEFSPFGPEIADIEISTSCSKGCLHCYKSNTKNGKYMKFSTFKKVFHKLPKTLTQIAFGIGDIDSNPDLEKIFKYCRKHKVIPNITINGERMTHKYYQMLAKYCGAVAVSYYNTHKCFNAIASLHDYGLKQVNIHALLSQETYDQCLKLIELSKTDLRLINLNAIVFLLLKPKGTRNNFNSITKLCDYKALVDKALELNAKIGFDSCSAPHFLKSVKERKEYDAYRMLAEPCESTLFSIYINVDGIVYPCSFTEKEQNVEGINLLKSRNFLNDIWFGKATKDFRETLMKTKDENGCRNCPKFNLKME